MNLESAFDGQKSAGASFQQEQGPSLNAKREVLSLAHGNPSLLLWLLMHGFKATRQGQRGSDCEWFVRRGVRVCKNLNIQWVLELRRRIALVLLSMLSGFRQRKSFARLDMCAHQGTGEQASK